MKKDLEDAGFANWWLLMALAVVILIAAGFFGWWFWGKTNSNVNVATNTSTAGWKTYENTKYGYTFKYPSEGLVSSNSYNLEEPVAADIRTSLPKLSNNIPDREIFGVLVINKNLSQGSDQKTQDMVGLPLKDYVDKLWQINRNDTEIKGKEAGPITETTLGGQKAYTFTLTKSYTQNGTGGYILTDENGNNYGKNTFIFTEKNGSKYELHYPTGFKTSESILSTFKFTNPAVSATDWKTYDGNDINYTFKYPSDWQIDKVGMANKLSKTLSLKNAVGDYITIYNPILETGYEGWQMDNPKNLVSMDGLIFQRDYGKAENTDLGDLYLITYSPADKNDFLTKSFSAIYSSKGEINKQMAEQVDEIFQTFSYKK